LTRGQKPIGWVLTGYHTIGSTRRALKRSNSLTTAYSATVD